MLSLLIALFLNVSPAQTTQAVVMGRVTDRETSRSVAGVQLRFTASESGLETSVISAPNGLYTVFGLTPATYRVRLEAAGYQALETHNARLAVASITELNFEMRRIEDVWEQRKYRGVALQPNRAVLRFFGPDLDPSRTVSRPAPDLSSAAREAALSDVITTDQLRSLPLAGRDTYTLLFLQPGVTSDAGNARGLGLSIGGQRPSASNFLLDGVENNNYLTSGPLHTVAPEAVQEYRISSGNYSAEFGRASGFVANAVTTTGGAAWHGLAYVYAKRDIFNANSFERNLQGLGKAPLREWQPGISLGGPVTKQRLFVSGAYERFHTTTTDMPVPLQVLTSSSRINTHPSSIARRLLDSLSQPLSEGRTFVISKHFEPALQLDRSLAFARADYVGRAHRTMIRFLRNRLDRPDFVWTPYEEFASPLAQHNSGATGSVASQWRNMLSEFRAAWQQDRLGWDRPRPDIPTLAPVFPVVTPGVEYVPSVLPGSPAFYGYSNRNRQFEFVGNVSGWRGRHSWKAGTALLARRMDGLLSAGTAGLISFDTAFDFLLDFPYKLRASVSRGSNSLLPDLARAYSNTQRSFFLHDNWRAGRQLMLTFGLRYEDFGAPVNRGHAGDRLMQLGTGASFSERLENAMIAMPLIRGQAVYQQDRNNVAPRVGFSWQPRGDVGAVIRGSYGLFYDRPFDNLWQNVRSNSFTLAQAELPPGINYLSGIDNLLRTVRATTEDFPEPLLLQSGLRDAYSHNFFFGVQNVAWERVTLEWNGMGALARKLITSDRINRLFFRDNSSLPTIAYRANQGVSNYYAASVAARYRSPSLNVRASYTWAHWIDNQSEALAGDFFNLDFTRLNYQSRNVQTATFSRTGDSRGDRGNSDFDQRHNAGVWAIWDVPRARGVRLAGTAAVRSGFPFTVISPDESSQGSVLYNRRADLLAPSATVDQSVDGGRRLLNRDAFGVPSDGAQGNMARNSLRGPGLWNLDFSVAKSFTLREAKRLTLRADAFNVMNHVNLNPPDALLTSESFGFAQFGRRGRDTGFPALFPFNETPRQIQLLLRLDF
jgi:hypothetical protein